MRCRLPGCGAGFFWAVTATGSLMPIDEATLDEPSATLAIWRTDNDPVTAPGAEAAGRIPWRARVLAEPEPAGQGALELDIPGAGGAQLAAGERRARPHWETCTSPQANIDHVRKGKR